MLILFYPELSDFCKKGRARMHLHPVDRQIALVVASHKKE